MLKPDSYAEMSDDDFEAQMESGVTTLEAPEEESPADSGTDMPESDEPQEEVINDGEDYVDETTEEQEEEAEQEPTESDEPSEELDTADTTSDDVGEDDKLDPQLAELFEPFKAAGSEMQVRTVAEARQLMQMGVGFNNRMAELKPHRKTIKTLANNEIDNDRLNFLIDLSKGNKDAIAKLIKETEYDVHTDDSEDSSYSPSDYSVSDADVDLDDVISRIQPTDAFSTTSDIVSKQWDKASKQAIFENPKYLEDLNTQVANGTYARVKQEVTRQQAFGGLQGLNDLQAYAKVGQELEQKGAFTAKATPPKVVKTAPKVAKNTNTKQKLSASSSKGKAPSMVDKVSDYSKMDDAAFEKLLNK